MYKSFRVKNFRCFKDLQINDLGRVNLIAGKNNTGKTALMEAMYLHTRPHSPQELSRLQLARGLDTSEYERVSDWRQFFYGLDSTQKIVIDGRGGILEQYPTLCIRELPNLPENAHVFKAYTKNLHGLGMSQLDAAKAISELDKILHFELHGHSTSYLSSILPSDPKLPTIGFKREPEHSDFISMQGRPSNESIADQYSKLKQTGKHNSVDDALKQLEPNLTDLEVLTPFGYRMLWGQYNNIFLPLRSLGEGTNRIAHFLITMMYHDPMQLFIDEVENGIHHSVQKEVWKAIDEFSDAMDIQVFATTHSLEMVRAAYEAFNEKNKFREKNKLNGFRYHRLDRNSDTGDIEAVTYNEFVMKAAMSTNWEIR